MLLPSDIFLKSVIIKNSKLLINGCSTLKLQFSDQHSTDHYKNYLIVKKIAESQNISDAQSDLPISNPNQSIKFPLIVNGEQCPQSTRPPKSSVKRKTCLLNWQWWAQTSTMRFGFEFYGWFQSSVRGNAPIPLTINGKCCIGWSSKLCSKARHLLMFLVFTIFIRIIILIFVRRVTITPKIE